MPVMESLKRKGNIIPVCTSDFETMLTIVEALNNPYYLKNGKASANKLRVILMKNEPSVLSAIQSAQLFKYIIMDEQKNYSITEKGKKLIQLTKTDKKISIATEILGIQAYKSIFSRIDSNNGKLQISEIENEFKVVMPKIDEYNLKNIVESFISFGIYAEIIEHTNDSDGKTIKNTPKIQEIKDRISGKDNINEKQLKLKKLNKARNFENLNSPICISDCQTMMDVTESLNNPFYVKNGTATMQKLRVITMKKEAVIKRGLQSAQLMNFVKLNDDKTYSITEKGTKLIRARNIEKKEMIGKEILKIVPYKDFLSLTETNGGNASIDDVENTFKIIVPGIDNENLKKLVTSFISFGYFSEIIVPSEDEENPGILITSKLKETIEKIQQGEEEERRIMASEVLSELSKSNSMDFLSKLNETPLPIYECDIMLDVLEALHNPYYVKAGTASIQKLRVVLMKNEQYIIKGLLTAMFFKFVVKKGEKNQSYRITEKGEDLIELRQTDKKDLLGEEIIQIELYKKILASIEEKNGIIKVSELEEEFKSVSEENDYVSQRELMQSFISFGYFTEIFIPCEIDKNPGIKITPMLKELREKLEEGLKIAEKKKASIPLATQAHSSICGACGGGILPTFSMCPYCGTGLNRSEEETDYRMIYVKLFFSKTLKDMDISQLRGVVKVLSGKSNRNMTKNELVNYIESKKWAKKEQ